MNLTYSVKPPPVKTNIATSSRKAPIRWQALPYPTASAMKTVMHLPYMHSSTTT